jgi:hypothetical protein
MIVMKCRIKLNATRYLPFEAEAHLFWYSDYGGEADVSLDCGRFYRPFICPQMKWMKE